MEMGYEWKVCDEIDDVRKYVRFYGKMVLGMRYVFNGY